MTDMKSPPKGCINHVLGLNHPDPPVVDVGTKENTMSYYFDRDYDDYDYDRPARRTRYRCGGYGSYYGHCGATDCETCYPGCSDREEEEPEGKVEVFKTVKARKARNVGQYNEIKVGDTVRVTSGFDYERGGPRIGYFRTYTRIAKGPAWDSEGSSLTHPA
jgi:hypothetical protein